MIEDKSLRNVLILEDEPDAGLLIAAILLGHNYTPTIVGTVKEAEAELRNQKEFTYDLLFFDYNLPDGTSFEILENNTLVGDSPIILCSAYLSPERQKEAVNLGALDCLHKPINGEAVRNILEKYALLN
jgi:DNA-binding response OmpR family regulator